MSQMNDGIFGEVDLSVNEPKKPKSEETESIFGELDFSLNEPTETVQEPEIVIEEPEDEGIFGAVNFDIDSPTEKPKEEIHVEEDNSDIFGALDFEVDEKIEEVNEEDLTLVTVPEVDLDEDLYEGQALVIESKAPARLDVYKNNIRSVPANCTQPMSDTDLIDVLQPSKRIEEGDEELALQKIEELRDVDRYTASPSLTVGVSVATYQNFMDSLGSHRYRLMGGKTEDDTKKFVEEEASVLPSYLRNHECINTINSMLQDKKTTQEIIENPVIAKRLQNEFQRLETIGYIDLKRDILARMNNKQVSAEKDANAYLESLANIFVQNEVFVNDFVDEVQAIIKNRDLTEEQRCQMLAEKLFYARAVIPSEGLFVCGKCGKLAHNKMPFFEYIQDDTSTSGSTKQGNMIKENARFCIFPPNKCEHCGAENILSGKEIAILSVKSKVYDLAKRERVIKIPTYAKYIPTYDTMYDDLGDVYFRSVGDYVAFEKTLNPDFSSDVVRDDLQLTGAVEEVKEPSLIDRYNIGDIDALWEKGIKDYKRAIKIFVQQKTQIKVDDHMKEVFASDKPMNEILPKISEGFSVNAKILCGIFGRDYNKMKTNAYHSLALILDDNGFTDIISRRPMSLAEVYSACKDYFNGNLNATDVQGIVTYLCEQFNIDNITILDRETNKYLPNYEELLEPLKFILDSFSEVEERKKFNRLLKELNDNFYLYTYTKINNARCQKLDVILSCPELRDWLNVTTDAMITNALSEAFAGYYIPVEASSYTPGSMGIGIKKTGDILKPQVDKKFRIVISKATSLDDPKRKDNIVKFYSSYLGLYDAGEKSILYAGLDIHCLEIISQLMKAMRQRDITRVYRLMMKLPKVLECDIINAPLLSKLRACILELKPLCDELYARYDNLADYQMEFNLEKDLDTDLVECLTVAYDGNGYIMKRHEGETPEQYVFRYVNAMVEDTNIPRAERESVDRHGVMDILETHKTVLLGATLVYSMCVSGIRGEITKYLLYRDALYMGNIAGKTIDSIVGISKQISATYLSRKSVNLLDEIVPANPEEVLCRDFVLNYPSVFENIEDMRLDDALTDGQKVDAIVNDTYFPQYLELVPYEIASKLKEVFEIRDLDDKTGKALDLINRFEELIPYRKEIGRAVLAPIGLIIKDKTLTQNEKAKKVIESGLLDSLYSYLGR